MVRAAIARPCEWWPPSCSLRINLAVFWCPACGAGNKPHGHASVVKPADLAFFLVILIEVGRNSACLLGFSFTSFFFFFSLQIAWNLNCLAED